MALIYITGIAGSGKSAVLKELGRRGYEVHDADENLSSWEHKTTRQRISASDHKSTTDPEFFEEHDWYIDKEEVSKLARNASHKTVFLCGSVANEAEVWSEFDNVCCLYVDSETLKRRIKNRSDKDFGKSRHELEHLLKLNDDVLRKYTPLGAVIIDATRPIGEVVEEILAKAHMKITDTNPVLRAANLRKPFNIFHTHVIDRQIMDAAVANRKSLEVDISITPEGSIYIGHPLSYYEAANLPPPNNLPLDGVVREAKEAGLFLVLDLKDVETIPTAEGIIKEYGAENCLVHAFNQELSFSPWPPEVEAIREPNWEQEELSLDKLLDLRKATGVPLVLSCHGITRERLSNEGEEILQRIVAVAKQGILGVSLSMPPDEETPAIFANKMLAKGVIPLIRFDQTTPQNRPDFFLGFTDHLERATDPQAF